jgi:hypothetical protein
MFDLPELNHHLMEGLAHPAQVKKNLHFVFLSSDLYSDRVKIRYPLTAEVVEKNEVEYSIYKAASKTRLAQLYEVLLFGSFLIFYQTRELGIDPVTIPWVDYFKNKLK